MPKSRFNLYEVWQRLRDPKEGTCPVCLGPARSNAFQLTIYCTDERCALTAQNIRNRYIRRGLPVPNVDPSLCLSCQEPIERARRETFYYCLYCIGEVLNDREINHRRRSRERMRRLRKEKNGTPVKEAPDP